MNNKFDFKRFARVLRLSWQTQPLLPYVVLLAAVPLMYWYFLKEASSPFVSFRSDSPFLIFATYFCGCGWLYAGLSFQDFAHEHTAVRYLQVPASTLEKWLAKLLLAVVVFPFITWLSFNLAFAGFEQISLHWFAYRYAALNWSERQMPVFFFFFSLLMPAALAAGLRWKRFGILKGLVFFFVLLVLLYQLTSIGFAQFPNDSGRGVLLQGVSFPHAGMDADASTQNLVHGFWLLAIYIPALLLLASTYFMIREKEI